MPEPVQDIRSGELIVKLTREQIKYRLNLQRFAVDEKDHEKMLEADQNSDEDVGLVA